MTRFKSRSGEWYFTESARWEGELLLGPGVRELVAAETAGLAAKMIKASPKSRAGVNWNSITKNITAEIERFEGESWVGYVVVEDDSDVRHTMLQEEGWRDAHHRFHAGRHFLKRVLEGEREL